MGSPQKRNTIDGGGFATEKERDWLAQRRTKNARRYPCGHVPRHARAQRQFRLRHGVLGQAGLGGQGQIRPGDRSGRAKAWGRVVLACAESRPNRTLHRPPTPHPSAAAGPRSPPTPTHPHCGVLPVLSQETMPDSSTTSASRATTRRATTPRACALPSCCVGAEASASTTPTRTATRPAPLSRIRKNLPCDPFVVFVFARDFF